MAKQTKKPAEGNTPAISEAEVIVSTEVVQIVPVENTGKAVTLFTPANTEKLVKLFVNSEVINFDYTAEKCAELVKTHSKKKVKDKDDVKGYEAVKAAYNELVKVRTSTDKKRSEVVKPYVDIKAGIDKYAKNDIIGTLAAEEARLKGEKEKFEKWEAEEQAKREAEEQKRLDERIAELKAAGLTFDGELYVIGENISVDIVTIKKMKDADYAFFLAKVKDEKAKIDQAAEDAAAAKAEEERKAAEQKAENERNAKELRDEKLDLRRDVLTGAGFTEDTEKERFFIAGTGYLFEITYDEVAELNAADFKQYLADTAQNVEAAQAATAQQTPAEPETKEEEQPQEQPAQEEQEDNRPDFDKLRDYVNAINGCEIPQLHTARANELLAEFRNSIKLAADNLHKGIKTAENE